MNVIASRASRPNNQWLSTKLYEIDAIKTRGAERFDHAPLPVPQKLILRLPAGRAM